MTDGSEKRNRQLAFELQNSHVCEKRSNHWRLSCLVLRPHYYARPIRFGSRGPRKFLGASPGRSSRIRHRNALTDRAWKDAV